MNFAALIRPSWLPLLLACVLTAGAVDARAQLPTKPGKYGKTLVMDKMLPPSDIEKISSFLRDLEAQNKGVANSVMFGDTVDWVGDPMVGEPAKSPYTMVVSVTGTAKAAGNVLTSWKSGWKIDDNASKISLMSGLSAFEVKAGERVTMTAAAAPSRFDRDKNVVPLLSLIEAKNVAIESVQVQVWSGMPGTTALQWLTAYPLLWFGVVVLVVTLVFRKI